MIILAKSFGMKFFSKIIYLLLLLFFTEAHSQLKTVYHDSDGSTIFIPLGKISFADEVVKFDIGTPKPFKIFRDSSQALHEPNYTKYEKPDFVSLGCGGQLTLKFTNNGFMNLKGDDLYIFEVGPSKESARIEVSADGENWIFAGDTRGGKSTIDMSDANVDTETIFYYIRITDLKDLCRIKTAGVDIDAVAAINSVIKLDIAADVLFDVAQFNLKETATKTLDSISKILTQVPRATILIEGHTDSDGSDQYNVDLSKNRCISVKERLRNAIGDHNRFDFEIKAYGKSKPRVPNDSPENKQLNRRVEIMVLPPREYYDNLPNKK